MDSLRLMNVFVAVAETESFAGGARRLRMSPPAVTRAVAALEARLRVRLLDRTTRFVRVTEAGQRYLDDARRIIGEVREANEAAAGVDAEPRGQLAVTAPALFGKMFVTPGIVEYLRRFPGAEVSALFLDRVVNLVDEGLDVGVRIGELQDSSMKAIGVGGVRQIVCASPAYLKEHGTPGDPADLARHVVILSSAVTPVVRWKFLRDSRSAVVGVRPRLTVNSNEAAIEAACLGFGITRVLSYQVVPHLASGRLKPILTRFEPERLPVHVLHREGRYASAKVRAFVDLMVGRLRKDATRW